MGLVVTTASVGIGITVFGYLTPWPLLHPVKILGNVSGAALIAGLAVFMYRRIADKENAGQEHVFGLALPGHLAAHDHHRLPL